MKKGITQAEWHEYQGAWSHVDAEVIEEALIVLYVNGREIANVMCTPNSLEDLAIGFLANEGLIESVAEVDHTFVSSQECCVDVWLRRGFKEPTRKIITSGCGGGVTFTDPATGVEPIRVKNQLEPARLFDMFGLLQTSSSLYAKARGVHSAGLFNGDQLVLRVDDVGRHNTIDKLRGACMRSSISTSGLALLCTGRISSEMLHKGALMGCPIVASRTSPTSLSIEMAEAWNITLVGYVRRNSLRAYTHPWRLGLEHSA
jgi:FdhD protein